MWKNDEGEICRSLKINGVNIRSTVEGDDELSYSFGSGSAISKAKAINHSTQYTGVRAIVGHKWRGESHLKIQPQERRTKE